MLKHITVGMVFRFGMIAFIEATIVLRILPMAKTPEQWWWIAAVGAVFPLAMLGVEAAAFFQQRSSGEYAKTLRHRRSPAGHEQAEAHGVAAKGWRYAASIALAVAGAAIAGLCILIR